MSADGYGAMDAVHTVLERIEAAAAEMRGAVDEQRMTAASNADHALREALADFALAVASLTTQPSEVELAALHKRLEAAGDVHRRATAIVATMRNSAAEELARARQGRRGTNAYLETATA